MDRHITVNAAYSGQQITGQQRYAMEIARVLEAYPDVVSVAPDERVASSKLASWVWVQTALPWRARRAVLLSMTSRAPLLHPVHVVVVHDLFVLTNPEWYSRPYVATHAPLLRAHLRDAKVIVTVSEPVAAQVRARVRPDVPVVVATNAPSSVFRERRSREEISTVLDRYGLRDRGFLLAVGSMDPRKNLSRLTQAFLALPADVRSATPLVLVGAQNSLFGAVDVQQADDIRLTGYVSDEDLAVLYGVARGVVFPSLAEGFGLPLVEAMVAGARLAVSDIEVFRWICGDEAEYFDPADADSITAALAALASTHPRPEAAVAALAAVVSTRFDWNVSARTIYDVCRRVRTR